MADHTGTHLNPLPSQADIQAGANTATAQSNKSSSRDIESLNMVRRDSEIRESAQSCRRFMNIMLGIFLSVAGLSLTWAIVCVVMNWLDETGQGPKP